MMTSTVQQLNGQGTYDVSMLGFNYRMTELNAALGLVQLGKLSGWNTPRKTLSLKYRQMLTGSGIDAPCPSQSLFTHHNLPLLLPASADRGLFIPALRDEGIQTSFHYPPIHRLSCYRDRDPDVRLPLTERFPSREWTLPPHPKMEDAQVEGVVRVLLRTLAH